MHAGLLVVGVLILIILSYGLIAPVLGAPELFPRKIWIYVPAVIVSGALLYFGLIPGELDEARKIMNAVVMEEIPGRPPKVVNADAFIYDACIPFVEKYKDPEFADQLKGMAAKSKNSGPDEQATAASCKVILRTSMGTLNKR